MVVLYCYLERKNYKVLKFHENNYSYFEITFSERPSKKGHKFKFQNQTSAEAGYYKKNSTLKREILSKLCR